MASLATSIMDSSFGGFDEYPLTGGMVSQLTMQWEHDASCVTDVASLELVDVNTAAPGFLADTFSTEPVHSGLSTKLTDFGLGDDFTLFEGLHSDGFDLESLIGDPVPAAVEAPQVEHGWMTSPTDISTLANVSSDSLKDLSSPPDSPDSGISSLETASSPGSVYSIDTSATASPSPLDISTSPSPEEPILLDVSAEDLALLESLWENDLSEPEPAVPSQTGPKAMLTTIALDPIPFVKLSPKPISPAPRSLKASKPAKALTTAEKKERKRAQNKNAATRYREKKRDEERHIYEEQTALEGKNKGLHDKVTLITREIQYMKELLIEVYRAKGMIE